ARREKEAGPAVGGRARANATPGQEAQALEELPARTEVSFSPPAGHATLVLRSRTTRLVVTIALLIGAVFLVFSLGAAPDTWRDVRRFLREAELEEAVDYLRGFGGWTVVIVLALFVVESLLAPLPTWFLMIADGMLFGPWLGGLVS